MNLLKKTLSGAVHWGLAAGCGLACVASAQVPITTLVSFNVLNGALPASALIQAADGAFYGVANAGGTSNLGVVFRITSDGALSNLVSFSGTNGAYPGSNPTARLTWGTNGVMYGTTSAGGGNDLGTVFQLTTNGAFTSLVSFTGTNGPALGAIPSAALLFANDGNLYGTTESGGTNDLSNGGDGTVFRMTPGGNVTTLWSFDYTNSGANPYAALIQGSNGDLYGTTQTGGSNGYGTLFEITKGGTLKTLISFDTTNGANPQTGLTLGRDGNFYGTTYFGGATNAGTAFRLSQTGAFASLISFNNTNGANPFGDLVLASDGTLYGTTQTGGASGYGAIFRLTTAGAISPLASFGLTNGQYPVAGLVQGTDGNFYGTTFWGGAYARGTVFRMPPIPVILQWKLTGGAFSLGWTAATGQVYQVQYTTNATRPSWNSLGGPLTATNPLATANDPSASGPQRTYRVQLLP